MMREKAKPDTNQGEIVSQLRDIPGCTVQLLTQVGKGCPDILVGHNGKTFGPYEIKHGKNKLNAREEVWWQTWTGAGCTVWCVDDILRDMGILPPPVRIWKRETK